MRNTVYTFKKINMKHTHLDSTIHQEKGKDSNNEKKIKYENVLIRTFYVKKKRQYF